MLENISDSSWSSEFAKENLKLLQLELLERYAEEEEVQTFIDNNIEYSSFREKAITR
jgi:hypothetical protein